MTCDNIRESTSSNSYFEHGLHFGGRLKSLLQRHLDFVDTKMEKNNELTEFV